MQTAAGKWGYATLHTGPMRNAGNYIVRFVAENAVGFTVSGIDVS